MGVKIRYIKRALIVIISLITLILFLLYIKNTTAILIIINTSFILILYLTKKENNLESYAPFFLAIILSIVFIYQEKSVPEPQISVDTIRQIFEAQNPVGNYAYIIKLNKLEAISMVPFGNFRLPSIMHNLDYLDENPIPENYYFVEIKNGGGTIVKSLDIHIQTPFNIKKDDIILSTGIDYKWDEGEISSGKLYLRIGFLDIGESAYILFKNKNIGNISLSKCLISNEPINCHTKNYDIFLIRMPENRTIEGTDENGILISHTFPILNENGLYHITENRDLEYESFICIPRGMSSSVCGV